VAAAAIWFFAPNGTPPEVGAPLAPDIVDAPQPGPEIDSRDVLDGDFAVTQFENPLDGETGLVLGYTDNSDVWYEGYERDYDRGFAEFQAFAQAAKDAGCDWRFASCDGEPDYAGTLEGYVDGAEDAKALASFGEISNSQKAEPPGPIAAAVAAFDLATGERRWQVDLLELAGLDPDAVPNGSLDVRVLPCGPGAVITEVAELAATTSHVAALAADGSVVSQAEVEGGLTECRSGIAIMFSHESDDEIAHSTSALGEELWRAPGRRDGWPLFHEPSGTSWVHSVAGYVDAATGALFGFGADADPAGVFYRIAPSGAEPRVLRFDQETRLVSRLDPATGEDIWAETFDYDAYGPVAFTPDALLLQREAGSTFDDDGLPTSYSKDVIAVSLDSGEILWEAESGGLEAVEGRDYSAVAGDPVLAHKQALGAEHLAFDAATGALEFALDPGEGYSLGAQGDAVAYFLRAKDQLASVRTFSLADAGRPLWDHDLAYSDGLERCQLDHGSGRLWLKCSNQEGPNQTMRLIG
jgi:outer membrane protein assembly factor BamB